MIGLSSMRILKHSIYVKAFILLKFLVCFDANSALILDELEEIQPSLFFSTAVLSVDNYVCSACLVDYEGEDVWLTAAHCIYGREGISLLFEGNEYPVTYAGVHRKYRANPDPGLNKGFDLAIVKIDKTFPQKAKVFTQAPASKFLAISVSIKEEDKGSPFYRTSLFALGVRLNSEENVLESGFNFDCLSPTFSYCSPGYLTPADSGSGLYTYDSESSTWALIGVATGVIRHKDVQRWGGILTNYWVPIDVSYIGKFLRRYKAERLKTGGEGA